MLTDSVKRARAIRDDGSHSAGGREEGGNWACLVGLQTFLTFVSLRGNSDSYLLFFEGR